MPLFEVRAVSEADRLRTADVLLRGIDPEFPDRATVLAAARQVGDVIAESLDRLPWGLLRPATEVQLRLVSYGPPEATVWRMGRAELEDLCLRLRSFIGLAAAAPTADVA